MAHLPLTLAHDLAVLCEGEADKNFLKKLCESRPAMPSFDFPFPSRVLFGNTRFGDMLEALRGEQIHFPRIKGILIVADSGNAASTMFTDICGQIGTANGFGIPAAPMALATSQDRPAVAVTLLPDNNTSGSLETLLALALIGKYPNSSIEQCVDTFMRCDNIQAHSWPPEKRDKARYHSMVSVSHRDDPSRAASWAFRDPPVVDIANPCFDNVANRLRAFEAAVRALPINQG